MSLKNLDTDIQKYIDLIRRLESSGHLFDNDPKLVDHDLKHNVVGSFSDKLIIRADAIDPQHKLLHALTRAKFVLSGIDRAWVIGYFVLGFIGTIGLLNIPVLNFFYVLIGLIGWHTLTLVWWLISMRSRERYLALDYLIERVRPKDAVHGHAFDIQLSEILPTQKWYMSKLIHKGWLGALAGTLLALLLMFLFKRYAFTWESTLLLESHFYGILKVIGFLPALIGIDLPTQSELSHGGGANKLALIMMMSVVLYAILPRFLAYFFCKLKCRQSFVIDTNLFYYENLHRNIMTKITDADDFVKSETIKPKQAKPSHNKKIVALLERHHIDEFWYQQGIGANVHDIGVVDTKEEIEKLGKWVTLYEAQICLGILNSTLPDRGVIKKFEHIINLAHHGIIVQLLDDPTSHNNYHSEWQKVLAECGIHEIRY